MFGDLYLRLIDHLPGGPNLEEAQKLLEKRLDDGGFVRNHALRSSSTNMLPRP